MSRLVIVRHGETEWHAENRFAGRTDIGLTAEGYKQAEALAGWARSAGLTAVWTSPLRRARLTAEKAARAASLPLLVDERLVELDFGRGEGLTAAEMRVAFPEARAAFERDPVQHPLPEGEDPEAAVTRGLAALEEIASADPHGRSLVVAHSTLLRLALCRMLGVPTCHYRTTFADFANASLTEVHLKPHGWAILTYNAPLSR